MVRGIEIGIVSALTITFITLKLCKVIAWSWWWVLSPLWIFVSCLVFTIIVAANVLKVLKNEIERR